MSGSLVGKTLSSARGLRRIPVARLVALAELAVLVRDHMQKLSPSERRRIVVLVRQGRGRPSSLTARERRELYILLAKTEPRMFVNRAVQQVTGAPVKGRRRDRR